MRLAVHGADEVSLRRLDAVLRAAGVVPVLGAADPVLVLLWSGRGITARVGPRDSAGSVRAALEAGADGFVFEHQLDGALVPTVQAVLAGQVSVPAIHKREVGTPAFTAREKQVLSMVVMGLSNKEIGARLFLADSTVKSHLSSIFTKLGVRSRHEAAALILDPDSKLGLGILGLSPDVRRHA
jgi:DNA-binding CsgD family transcriptional regulator